MEHNNKYIITFVLILTSVVALVLASMSTFLRPIHERNEAIFNKRSILSSIGSHLPKKLADMSDDDVVELFKTKITQTVLDAKGNEVEGILAEKVKLKDEFKISADKRHYPLFTYEAKGKKYYIFSARGKGLWDAIWGNIALEDDLNTITGVSFDHAAETPGLGAEIKDNASFVKQFIGRKIFKNEKLVGVKVRKGGAVDKMHEVDAISGATLTCDGLTDMIFSGLNAYQPYFKAKRK